MKRLFSKLSAPKAFYYILFAGIVLRVFFVFWGGKIYYGKADYFTQGDTPAWFHSFVNLVETGTYTVNPAIDNGKYFRPPGYAFLFGLFYLLTFKNYLLASKLLVLFQVLMDIFSIWLVRQIARLSTRDREEKGIVIFSNAASLLYALYPFAIVWAPVLYAETSSVFFLLLSVFFSMKFLSGKNALLSGVFGGIAALVRLQCIFSLPLIFLSIFLRREKTKRKIRAMVFFGFGIMMTYGLWPARNYFFHHRILFSQELNIGRFWSEDYLAFMDYVYSIRTDHTPVYRSLIRGEKANWPAAAYLSERDTALLDSVSNLCSTCGTGFSYWMVAEGARPETVLPSENCDTAIAAIFKKLTAEQKRNNPFHYWITVPLGNLQKCFFKFSIYGNKGFTVKLLSTLLFILRTTFIFLGIYGLYLAYKTRFFENAFLFFIFSYPFVWTLYLAFFYRNMEIRYLLQTDILLLLPAAYFLSGWLLSRYQKVT